MEWENSQSGGNDPIAELLKDRRLQWAVIAAVNIVAALNYLELTPSIYPIYAIGGFEFLARAVFADLLARFAGGRGGVPAVWWLAAYLFSPVTFLYLYFIPPDKNRPRGEQRGYDMIFAAACALYFLLGLINI